MMKRRYYELMYKINSFLYGRFSTKADKYQVKMIIEGFNKGMKSQEGIRRSL